ncbi:MAG: efflux RND transporter periplasmic adaptor subunit [Thermodesulfobacteriota bacterium]|nr:efflux RND transporter periplasmic adaptor subunit [Thermodesulfobacteriota bacterium]
MKKKFLFKGVRSVGVLVLAGAIAFFIYVNKPQPEKKDRVPVRPVVEVMPAAPETEVMKIEAYGTVVPRVHLKISAEVSGRIVFLHPGFEAGRLIHAGELVLKIDSMTYALDKRAGLAAIDRVKAEMARLKQEILNLKANIKLATMDFKLSQTELNRFETLKKEDFATKNSVDLALQRKIQSQIKLQDFKNRLAVTDASMEGLRASLEMEKTRLARADLALEKSRIQADFDGFVLENHVEKGEYIHAGQIIGEMYAENMLDVNVRIPLENMKWISPVFKRGDFPEAEVKISGGDDNQVWHGRIARVHARIDERTRMLPMVIELESAQDSQGPLTHLRPGNFVSCLIFGETFEKLYTIPRHILRPGNIIAVVENNKVVKKKVSVLRHFKERVYVCKGLSKGDMMITSPLPDAAEGMAVKIQKKGQGR